MGVTAHHPGSRANTHELHSTALFGNCQYILTSSPVAELRMRAGTIWGTPLGTTDYKGDFSDALHDQNHRPEKGLSPQGDIGE